MAFSPRAHRRERSRAGRANSAAGSDQGAAVERGGPGDQPRRQRLRVQRGAGDRAMRYAKLWVLAAAAGLLSFPAAAAAKPLDAYGFGARASALRSASTNVAAEIIPNLYFGLGLTYIASTSGTLDIFGSVNTTDPQHTRLSSAVDVTFSSVRYPTIGLLWTPGNWRFGVTYRHEFVLTL